MTSRDVKLELEAAIAERIAAGGMGAVSVVELVREFAGRAPERSLYRWCGMILSSGSAIALPKLPKVTRGGKTARLQPAPGPEPKAEPNPASPASVAPSGAMLATSPPTPGNVLAVLDLLSDCIRAAQQVMNYARKDDGSVRNAKLLIASSEHLRRNLDTAVKLRESMRQDRDLDAFLEEVVREIQKEAPDLAQRLLQRLSDLLTLRGV